MAGSEANAFFPSASTIHVGDSVRFVPVGFHNLDLPKKGGKATAIVTAQAGRTVTAANDAAGVPYWFNGQPVLGVNFPALAPVGFEEDVHLHRRHRRPERPTGRRQAKADDGDVHEDGHVHLFLRPAPRHEGHREGAGREQERPVDQGPRQAHHGPGLRRGGHGRDASEGQGAGRHRRHRRRRQGRRRVTTASCPPRRRCPWARR